MIRIGFDARWFNTSGVGTYVSNLLECLSGLDDEGFEMIVYEHANNPVPLESVRIKKRIVRSAKYSFSEQWELAYYCVRDKLNVFHAPFYIVPLFAPCPVIVTVHDLMAFLFPIYGFLHQETVKAGYRMAMAKSKSVIAISETTREDLVAILHVPRVKIRRIYNAYSKTMYHDRAEPGEQEYLKERYGISKPYALTLSAANWRTKNLRGAMRALASAEQHLGMSFQSVIAGPVEGYYASGLVGLIKNQVVTGFVPKEDLPKLYRNASAFLSVSLYEGFGAPLMEAMGCGCPTIVSTGGSLPEIAGDASRCFACDDYQAMATELIRLIRDSAYCEQRRMESIRRASQFSYMNCARETLNLYREVAGKRSCSALPKT